VDWVQGKHVYLNEDRIATKYNSEGNDNTGAEKERTYYYHSDHLGSAQVVTNWNGQIHERLEYTPYGELWIDWKGDSALEDSTPFRFTGKEMDAETGFYYYGARYLDPKTSRWISADPALGDYVPSAPVNEEAKKRNGNLPGQGGVFNYVNLHVYHYAGNNPVKYVDPDGRTGSFPDGSPEQNRQWERAQEARAKFKSEGMNEKFVNEAMERLGPQNYVYGGKIPETDGGTDCSGTVDWAVEKTVGQKIKDRKADSQAKDPNFTVPGDNSRGSLNFYDWDNDGVFDHVTINLGDGTEINPYGGESNTKDNPAPILIKPIPELKKGQTMVNRSLKWRYLAR
jgi:RHS repeat-associated protein